MKTNKFQSGSVHIVIAISLVLVIIVALGWVLWQNRPTTSQSNTSNDSASEQDKEASKTAVLSTCTRVEKICFEYPKTWEHKSITEQLKYGDTNIDTDNDTISDSKTGLTLKVETGIGQIGGMCLPEETNSYAYTVQTKETKLMSSAFNDTPSRIYVVKAVFANEDGAFTPAVLLSNGKELTKIGNHEPCSTGYENLFKQKNGVDGYNLMTFGTIGMLNVDSNVVNEKEFATFNEAKDALRTDAYNQAFQILSSVSYKT